MLEQGEIPRPIARLDALNLRQRGFQGATVVEGIAIGELEPIPRRQRNELHMIGETFTKEGEQLFEQERRGNDRRAGVVSEALALIDLSAAA